MWQNPSSADDESFFVTRSEFTPRPRLSTPYPDPPEDMEPELGSTQISRGAWSRLHRSVLNGAFLDSMLALGMLLGIVLSGYAASLRSSSMPSRPSLHPPPKTPTTVIGDVPVTAATLDARFAIVTLGVQCLGDACVESRYVPADQRIYASWGGWSCTTVSAAEVVGNQEQYVYCRLDQPNEFTATFDGAQFFCIGSRLGCHFVVLVETTNGR